jgi:hypothetical protein
MEQHPLGTLIDFVFSLADESKRTGNTSVFDLAKTTLESVKAHPQKNDTQSEDNFRSRTQELSAPLPKNTLSEELRRLTCAIDTENAEKDREIKELKARISNLESQIMRMRTIELQNRLTKILCEDGLGKLLRPSAVPTPSNLSGFGSSVPSNVGRVPSNLSHYFGIDEDEDDDPTRDYTTIRVSPGDASRY